MEATVLARSFKHQRVLEFFAMLDEQQRACKSAAHAHLHMKNCFNAIEEKHVSPPSGRMSLLPLQNFSFLGKLQLFAWRADYNVILIHENGAYAIYEMVGDGTAIESYKDFQPIVMINSHSGKSVWEDLETV